MTTNYLASVPKLRGRENYDDWCFAAQNLLVLEGMAASIQSQLKSTATAEQKVKDAKAKAKLILSIDPSIYVHIKQAVTTYDLWTTLKKMFDDSGYTRKICLLRNLINIRLENCESMTQYVTQIIETSQRLQGTGFKITDEWVGALMLAGLPEKCKKTGHYKNQCPQEETTKRKQTNAFNAIFLTGKFNKDSWYIDSGASKHMTACKNNLVNSSHQHEIKEIIIANQTRVPVLCSGDVNIVTVVKDVEYDITVKDVLFIPDLTTNLLSVSQLIRSGNSVIFEENVCYIYNRQRELVGQAELIDGVYKLCTLQTEQILAATAIASSETWHRRMGHINSNSLNKMRNGAVDGILYPDMAEIDKTSCVICCKGKQTRLPFQLSSSKTKDLLELIHSDVAGPMENLSIGGSRYYVLFVDDFSKMAFVYFMKAKSEVFKYFVEFQSMVEKQKDRKIKILRTDNGGEFCGQEFEKYLKKQGIVHQRTNAYTPEQNGLCERMNRSIVEKARCLIFDADLDKKFWSEAVNTSVYLRNRSVVTGLNNRTPYEVWSGQKPNLSHLRIFGSKVMVHVPKQKRLKWDEKAKQLILVGYAENIKGYRVYDKKSNTVTTSRDIVIMESSNESVRDTVQIPVDCKSSVEESITKENESTILEEDNDQDKTYIPDAEASSVSDSSDSFFDATIDSDITLVEQEKLPRRTRRQPDWYTNLCIAECEDIDREVTLDEALNGPESVFWRASMKEELDSFKQNEAWELVDTILKIVR
ncbi:unnamed protein product [Colias eurytheme]|nr:unnamed protein product [Colias eurytheme]